MPGKLSYEVFKHDGIRRTTEDTRENDPALGIGKRYLISLIAVELCCLRRTLAKWCPTCPSEPSPFITPIFIGIHGVAGGS